MSKIAYLLHADGTFETVFAKGCSELDRDKPFVCPDCGCPMHLRMGDVAEKHFFGDHTNECLIAANRYKVSITTTGYVLAIKSLLKHVDKPISEEEKVITHDSDSEGHNPLPKKRGEMFTVFVPGIRSLTSITSIFNYISPIPLDEVIDIDTGLKVKDLLINDRTIYDCRRDGFDKEVRLAVTTRFSPSALENAPKKQGYLLLRDAFSRDNNDAIYFLIRIKEPSQYDKFRELLFGSKEHPERKSPQKHILLLANWHRMSGTKYHVYYADINAKSYAFIN